MEVLSTSATGHKLTNKFKFENANGRDLWKAFILGIANGEIPKDIHIMPGQLQDVFRAINDYRNTPPPVPNLPRPATFWSATDRLNQSGSTGGSMDESAGSSSPKMDNFAARAWSNGGLSPGGSVNSGDSADRDGSSSGHQTFSDADAASIAVRSSYNTVPAFHVNNNQSDNGDVLSLRQVMRRRKSIGLDLPKGTSARDSVSTQDANERESEFWENSRSPAVFDSGNRDLGYEEQTRTIESDYVRQRSVSSHGSEGDVFETSIGQKVFFNRTVSRASQNSGPEEASNWMLRPANTIERRFSEHNTQGHLFYTHPERNQEMPPWFFENCSREEAESILTLGKKNGNVLMRESSSQGSSYVISYRQEVTGGTQINHYKVNRVQRGFRIDVDNPHDTMGCLSDVMDFFVLVAGRGTQPMTTNTSHKGGIDSVSVVGPSSPTFTTPRAQFSPPPPPAPGGPPPPPPPPPIAPLSPAAAAPPPPPPPGGGPPPPPPPPPIGGIPPPPSPGGMQSATLAPSLPPRVRNAPPQGGFADPSLNQPVPSKHIPSDTIMRSDPVRDHQFGYNSGHMRNNSIPSQPAPGPPGGMPPISPSTMPALRPVGERTLGPMLPAVRTFEDELRDRVAIQREDIYSKSDLVIKRNY